MSTPSTPSSSAISYNDDIPRPPALPPSPRDSPRLLSPSTEGLVSIHQVTPRPLRPLQPAFSLRTPSPVPSSIPDHITELNEQADRFLKMVWDDFAKKDRIKKSCESQRKHMLETQKRLHPELYKTLGTPRRSPLVPLLPPYDPNPCRCPTHSCPQHPGNTPALAILVDQEPITFGGPTPPQQEIGTPPQPAPWQFTPTLISGPRKRILRTNLAAIQAKRRQYEEMEARARKLVGLGPYDHGTLLDLEGIVDLEVQPGWQ